MSIYAKKAGADFSNQVLPMIFAIGLMLVFSLITIFNVSIFMMIRSVHFLDREIAIFWAAAAALSSASI
jgi:hypothetical protein